MAQVIVEGRLGNDANLKYTPSGAAVLELSVADQPRKKTNTGWEDDGDPTWYRGSLWGPMAEQIAESGMATKGAIVNITGNLRSRKYESASGGGTSLDVRIDTIGFKERKGAPQQQRSAPAADPWATAGSAGSTEPPW